LVSVKGVIKTLTIGAATTAATLTGGPVVGAEVAVFLASPIGQKLIDDYLDQMAARDGIVLEDLAMGGLVTRPTLGFTGEAGPELVIPVNRNRSEQEYMRLRDMAQRTKNQVLENQLALESGTRPRNFNRKVTKKARASRKKLSRALKEANARYRLKNGQLRKGRTQADIMRLAQKLKKKM